MNQFEKEYKYTCSIELFGNIEEALRTYLDKDQFKYWHEGLAEIEEVSDNKYNMIYEFDNRRMAMGVEMVEFDPPHYAKTIYTMPKVWNLCIDKFEEKDGKILWTMDVVFRFEEEQHLLIDAFIRKTQAGMNIFKYYFENR